MPRARCFRCLPPLPRPFPRSPPPSRLVPLVLVALDCSRTVRAAAPDRADDVTLGLRSNIRKGAGETGGRRLWGPSDRPNAPSHQDRLSPSPNTHGCGDPATADLDRVNDPLTHSDRVSTPQTRQGSVRRSSPFRRRLLPIPTAHPDRSITRDARVNREGIRDHSRASQATSLQVGREAPRDDRGDTVKPAAVGRMRVLDRLA